MFEKWKSHMEEGDRALKMRDFAGAQEQFGRALVEAEKFGNNSSDLAYSLERYARSIVEAGMWTEENADLCFQLYQRACSIYEAVYGPVHAKVALCLTGMGRLIWLWEPDASAQLLMQALSIYRELRSSEVIEPLELLSRLLFIDEQQTELLVAATREIISEYTDDKKVLPRACMILASKVAMSDDEMVAHFRKALALAEGGTDQSALIVEANLELGKKLFASEKFDEAQTAFELAVSFGECSPDVSSTQLEEALCRLSRVHTIYHRDYKQSEKLLHHAEELLDRTIPAIHLNTEHRIWADTTGDYRHVIINLSARLDECRKDSARALAEQDTDRYQSVRMFESSVLIDMANAKGYLDEIEQSIELYKTALAIDVVNPIRKKAIESRVTPLLALSYAKSGKIDTAADIANGIIGGVNEFSRADTIATCLELTYLIGHTESFERLIEVASKHLESDSDMIQQTCLTIALALAASDRLSLAGDLLNRALGMVEGDSVFSAWLYEQYEWKLRRAGCATLAETLGDEARKIRDNFKKKSCA